MLFVLTGEVQTGKTRWLESLVAELAAVGVCAQGVLAPGVWRSGDDPDAMAKFVDANGFEKLGIDNVLLPQNERIAFARRRDIALELGLLDPQAQSEKAQLMWHIDDAAIDRVNEHLASLPHPSDAHENLLVIDELGRLEILRSEGLVEALRLLDQGPNQSFPHALVIVRDALLGQVINRFPRWGTTLPIAPDATGLEAVLTCYR